MNTVKIHPMAELLAKKLFSIENVPKNEQKKMVSRAIKEACKLYDEVVRCRCCGKENSAEVCGSCLSDISSDTASQAMESIG